MAHPSDVFGAHISIGSIIAIPHLRVHQLDQFIGVVVALGDEKYTVDFLSKESLEWEQWLVSYNTPVIQVNRLLSETADTWKNMLRVRSLELAHLYHTGTDSDIRANDQEVTG